MDYLAQNQLLFQPIFDVHDQQWFLMKVKTIRNVIKINNNKQVHKVENVNGGVRWSKKAKILST